MSVRHAPEGWQCPFCDIARGGESERTKRSAVIIEGPTMTAFVASHWWPGNPGHVLVIPNSHFENLYEFPPGLGVDLIAVTQRVAIAMKAAYACDGISTRQHNEPAGGQDVWHFHQHVFPRWANDRLYERHQERTPAPRNAIARHAASLRERLT